MKPHSSTPWPNRCLWLANACRRLLRFLYFPIPPFHTCMRTFVPWANVRACRVSIFTHACSNVYRLFSCLTVRTPLIYFKRPLLAPAFRGVLSSLSCFYCPFNVDLAAHLIWLTPYIRSLVSLFKFKFTFRQIDVYKHSFRSLTLSGRTNVVN